MNKPMGVFAPHLFWGTILALSIVTEIWAYASQTRFKVAAEVAGKY